jgi:hypothetical protein
LTYELVVKPWLEERERTGEALVGVGGSRRNYPTYRSARRNGPIGTARGESDGGEKGREKDDLMLSDIKEEGIRLRKRTTTTRSGLVGSTVSFGSQPLHSCPCVCV